MIKTPQVTSPAEIDSCLIPYWSQKRSSLNFYKTGLKKSGSVLALNFIVMRFTQTNNQEIIEKEEIMPAKILIKRQFKDGSIREVSALLNEFRSGAMNQPGYISGETLV